MLRLVLIALTTFALANCAAPGDVSDAPEL